MTEVIPEDVYAVRKEIFRILAAHYTPEEIALWWVSPHPMLGMQNAEFVLATGGEEKVLAVLRALDDAVYV